jgi:membrane-bound lytic murein transglycosylase B
VAGTVAMRAGTCQAKRDMTVPLPMSRWQALGVRTAGGGALPAKGPDAALVSGAKRHFLVYANYDALLDYNCAHSYAVTVGLLADRIGTPPPAAAAP